MFLLLCGAFVDYFPQSLVVFFHPVLALPHFVRQVIACVLLIEIHYRQVVSSWVEKHANITDSNLDPAFRGTDLALVLRPFSQSLVSACEIAPIVFQVGVDIATFPIPPPVFQMLGKLVTQDRRVRRFHPLDLIADDNRRYSHLQFGAKPVQILIGEHDATIAGTRRPAEGVRGGAVEPNPMSAPAVPFVPFIGVIDRKRFSTIKVGEFFARNISSNEVDAKGRFFVSLL